MANTELCANGSKWSRSTAVLGLIGDDISITCEAQRSSRLSDVEMGLENLRKGMQSHFSRLRTENCGPGTATFPHNVCRGAGSIVLPDSQKLNISPIDQRSHLAVDSFLACNGLLLPPGTSLEV